MEFPKFSQENLRIVASDIQDTDNLINGSGM